MRKVTKAMFAVMSAAAIGLTGGYYVSAQEYDKSGFCPITEGMTLEYQNYDAEGRKAGMYVLHVTAVSGTITDGTVSYDQYFYDENGQPLFSVDNNVPMEVTVGGPEGTVSRLNEVGKLLKVQDVMSKGDASNIPVELQAGTTIPDGKIKVQVGKITAHISTTGRQVTEQKSITVPAGTFDCFLIKEEQATKSFGTKVENVETWYAKGIGCVKQAVYDRKGRLDHTQELISIKFE